MKVKTEKQIRDAARRAADDAYFVEHGITGKRERSLAGKVYEWDSADDAALNAGIAEAMRLTKEKYSS